MGETSTVIGIPGATNCYSLHAAAALCRRCAGASLVTVMKFHDGLEKYPTLFCNYNTLDLATLVNLHLVKIIIYITC